MADHGAAVGASIGPVVAGEILLAPSCRYPWGKVAAMGEGSTMRVRTREYVVLVIRPFRPDPAVHQFTLFGQGCISIDQIAGALDVTM